MVQQKVGVKLFLDDDDYKKELKQSDKDSKTWAQGVSGSINKIVSVGQGLFFTINGFSQAFNLLKDAMNVPIDKASEFVEILGKATVVFGDNIDDVREWAQAFGNAETGVGRSEASLLSMLSTLQDTFVPMGFARKEASELAKTMTALAVDVASFNNEMDEDVIRDFQSTLVGNHETVRKYGIVITEATLKQEALDSGLIKLGGDLSNEAKIRARLNLIIQGTSDAQGDAMRTAESDANTRKRRNAILDDTLKILGDGLLPANTAWLNLQIDLIKVAKDFLSIPTSDKLRDEQTELNILVGLLQDTTTAQNTRNEAIRILEEKYPDYLVNIDLEKAGYEDLEKALKGANDEFMRRINLAVAEEALAEKALKIKNLQTAILDIEFQIAEQKEKGFKKDGQIADRVDAWIMQLDLAKLKVSGLKAEYDRFYKLLAEKGLTPDGPIVPGDDGTEPDGGEGSKSSKAKKADFDFAMRLIEMESKAIQEASEKEEKDREETQKKREKAETEELTRIIDLAVDMGDAFASGFDAEGIKGALKETLLLLISFYEKRLLLGAVEAGLQTLAGNPFAFFKLAGIAGGFELAKASIRNLADGGVAKATRGGMAVNIAEAGRDEVIAPLDGPASPFPQITAGLARIEQAVKDNPPVLLNSTIKGEDLKIIIDKQERKLL